MIRKIILSTILLSMAIAGGSFSVSAQNADDLRNQIDEYNQRIEELDREIKVFEKELLKIGADKQTLQNAINELNVARNKLSADISKTENQISKTNLTINQLGNEIRDKEQRIEDNKGAIAKTLNQIAIRDDVSTIEILLNQNNVADFWSELSELQSLNQGIQENIRNLEDLKLALGYQISESEEQKQELIGFKESLDNKKQAVDANRQEQDNLLKQTQNKESEYQSILGQKQAAREQFERDLADIESQLQFILDPNSIPQRGSGALGWPFNTSLFEPNSSITQLFGRTAHSGRLYSSGTHNGVDFGLPHGSEIRSAASGVVRETGNTDIGGCLSYGKWVLVDHENGLSSVYGHLSSVASTAGQKVNRGDVIAYSGNSGYSTGPHLHISVFATGGVNVINLGESNRSTPCVINNVRIPAAAAEAYLDPMEFFPN